MTSRRSFLTALISLLLVGVLTQANAAYQTGGVAKTILSNGVTVLMRKEPEAKFVAIEVFLRIGAEDESPTDAGIGQLLAGTILSGTETRSALKLSRLISEVGGNFHAVWQPNYLEIHAVTVPDMADETVSLLADSIMNSTLEPEAIEYSRKAILKEADRQADDPFTVAYNAVRHLVQRGTPYDRPYLGDTARVKAITRDQLKVFYDRNLSSDRLVISVVGNMDMTEVGKKIETCFGNMPRQRSERSAPTVPTASGGQSDVEKSVPSAYVMLGYPAPGVESPDYPAMCVANVLLGANKSSLLFRNVRERLGLGYQIGSLYPDLRGSGYVVAYLGLDSARATPDVLESARKAMLEQVDTLCAGRFTDEDIEYAKRYLIGNHALEHERTRDRAFHLGRYETIGLGYQYDFLYADKIKQVTREQVQTACVQYFKNPSVVTVAAPRANGVSSAREGASAP